MALTRTVGTVSTLAADGHDTDLPDALMALLGAYEVHLRSERGLSAHSVRAYLGDVSSLLDHAVRMNRPEIARLDLGVLRSWLARQASAGVARSTLARRAAAARTFTAWLARTGRIPTDPGALLATPRSGRTLPAVLRQDEASALLDVAAVAADDQDPARIRDVAVLEVLYARPCLLEHRGSQSRAPPQGHDERQTCARERGRGHLGALYADRCACDRDDRFGGQHVPRSPQRRRRARAARGRGYAGCREKRA